MIFLISDSKNNEKDNDSHDSFISESKKSEKGNDIHEVFDVRFQKE